MRFSKLTGCFYPEDITYAELPSDLIQVSQESFSIAMTRAPGEKLDVKNDFLIVVPRLEPSEAEIADEKWEAIKVERDRRTEIGGYKVDTKWFHSDQKSRSQQLGLALLGTNIPTNLLWKTMDGSFVAMTQTLAQQILFSAATSDQNVFATAEAKRVVIDASDDPAAYDVTVGWPKIFGE
jgi:hypothetical protein